jgi:hypothetical protein
VLIKTFIVLHLAFSSDSDNHAFSRPHQKNQESPHQDRPHGQHADGRTIPFGVPGAGIEFEEVREYTPGDDVKSIDWKVSARMGKPFIKRYREEREQVVMLLVDMSGSGRFRHHAKHQAGNRRGNCRHPGLQRHPQQR